MLVSSNVLRLRCWPARLMAGWFRMTLNVNRFELRPPANGWAKQWRAGNSNRSTITIILCRVGPLLKLDINIDILLYIEG